jgi:hypothetical protein
MRIRLFSTCLRVKKSTILLLDNFYEKADQRRDKSVQKTAACLCKKKHKTHKTPNSKLISAIYLNSVSRIAPSFKFIIFYCLSGDKFTFNHEPLVYTGHDLMSWIYHLLYHVIYLVIFRSQAAANWESLHLFMSSCHAQVIDRCIQAVNAFIHKLFLLSGHRSLQPHSPTGARARGSRTIHEPVCDFMISLWTAFSHFSAQRPILFEIEDKMPAITISLHDVHLIFLFE